MPDCFRTPGHRRGVALLVVLSIISVCLAVTYAVMRSQTVMLQVQQNAGTRVSARHAAMAGMSIALRKMHQNDWAGVGTMLKGRLGPDAGYTVTFTTGDPQLQDPMNPGSPDPTHSDFADWLFRVTVESVGLVSISGNGVAPAEHRVRAVMRLVPRALSTEPTPWNEINLYTIYQYQVAAAPTLLAFQRGLWARCGCADRLTFVPRCHGRILSNGSIWAIWWRCTTQVGSITDSLPEGSKCHCQANRRVTSGCYRTSWALRRYICPTSPCICPMLPESDMAGRDEAISQRRGP